MLVTMEASGSSGNGPLAFETLVIHGGVEAGNSDGAIIPPISMSAGKKLLNSTRHSSWRHQDTHCTGF